MARPTKTTLSYFSLDCNFFSSQKVKALRRAHGTVGVLAYLNILCKVYAHGFSYKFDDLQQLAFDIAEEIANDALGKVAARVSESINYMADIGLLDRDRLAMGVLTSHAIYERYKSAVEKFKRATPIPEYGPITLGVAVEEITVNSEETRVNSEETQVNSVETRRKEKEIENKQNNTSTHMRVRARAVTIACAEDCPIGVTDKDQAEFDWKAILDKLELKICSLPFEVWIKPLVPVGYYGDNLVVISPTNEHRNEVMERYAQNILEAMRVTSSD